MLFLNFILFDLFTLLILSVDIKAIEDDFEGSQIRTGVGGLPQILSEFLLHMLLVFLEIAVAADLEG